MGRGTRVLKMFNKFARIRGVQDIPRFELHELNLVLAQMRSNTAGDADG